MYLLASLLLGFVITIFLLSKIAEMLHAKEPGMLRIFAASLVGGIAASVAVLPIGWFVKGIDPLIMLLLTISIMFIVSSMAFKYINVMSWGGAITTNIANIVLSLVAVTAAVVLNGVPFDETLKSVGAGVSSTGALPEEYAYQAPAEEELVEAEEEIEDQVFKEADLLPPGTVKEIEAKKNKVIKAPRFRVVSINSIRSMVGKKIRIVNTNGNSITGALKDVVNNDAVIEQRMGGGVAVTPISLSKITKLEVYR